jgi:shikimate dehydrogenase
VISGRTRLFGVIGHPVGHSLSPAMHNAALAELGIDGAYVALPVAPEHLTEAIRGAHALGFHGLNVTVPHKLAVARLCQRLDHTAELCGAVNTLRRTPEGWEGFNTDAPACLAHLEACRVRPGTRALLLGAGGAAAAGAYALLTMGAEVTVAARRREAAEALRARLRPAFKDGVCHLAAWDEVPRLVAEAEAVLNATSLGMGGGDCELGGLRFRPSQLTLDFVYGGTAFGRAAAASGATLITGEQLLVRQGALAFTLFTGEPAPEALMTSALRSASPVR